MKPSQFGAQKRPVRASFTGRGQLGSAPVLMRGNTVNLAWIAVNVLALAVAADVVCRRRAARRERVVHTIPNLDVWVTK